MRAAYYEAFGPADKVLVIGEMPTPDPGPGEVLVRVLASGVNPSDVKLRAGSRGGDPAWPRTIPHSDGAGVIEAVGPGADPARVGERVWLWNAQWERAFGTAADYVALPSEHAVRLPENTSFAEGACFGIPAMTAWYALYGDTPDLAGKTVLVTGGAGTVGRYACQMAALGGARVITTVSGAEKAAHSTAGEWVNYREADVTEAVMDLTGGAGVDRIVDVDFAANQQASLGLLKPGCTLAAYASVSEREPVLAFYGFMFRDITLRMLIVYQLRGETRRRGEADLTAWLEAGRLSHAVVPAGGLADIAAAHDLVAAGEKMGSVVLEVS